MFPSCSKSADWFLYEGNIGHEKVKSGLINLNI